MRLEDLNALEEDAAERALRRGCGSARWAQAMTAARPFSSADAMAATADAIWVTLDPVDWQEAFAAHPRIGERSASAWASEEQSDARSASVIVRRKLADLNRLYEARFGYTFIVCATGKGADEIQGLLQQRLANDPAAELSVAADEQGKITRLRLEKLVEGG